MTQFRKWRLLMGYSQKEAAKVLHVSRSTVCNWDAGVDRRHKTVSTPSFCHRYLMRMLAVGMKPVAWPGKVMG
jgi:predicted transcriptional regulator